MSDVIQGSAQWKALRAGRVTASRIADIMARTKSGWGASRANYAAQLVAERLTGEVAESYTSAAMIWGTEQEPEARAAYSFRTDQTVTEVGFIEHPTIPMAGASPDGLVGDTGLVEFKCPQPAGHLAALRGEPIPQKYVFQMLWQMRCCERAWCDYVSYSPHFPESMRLVVTPVARNDTQIAELEREVRAFLAEIDATVLALRNRYLREAA